MLFRSLKHPEPEVQQSVQVIDKKTREIVKTIRVTEEKGKKFIKQTFSHFVTQSVVDELLANPDKIKLGCERKECTVFFSDVAGFTTISEQMSPEALVKLLNQYLTEMTNIIFKYDGMLDKYEGDAIMAVFGAPIAHGNHAYKCCAAALEMQEELVQFRELWKNREDQNCMPVVE